MDAVKNFAGGIVSTGYDAAATSIVLTSGYAARFAVASFNAVWWNYTDFPAAWDDPNVEIVRVTAIASETLTITRGQEGTSASTKNTAGKEYRIMQAVTKALLDQMVSDLDDPALGGELSGTASAATIAGGVIFDATVNPSAAIAQSKIASLTSDLALKAPLASPTFTGVPAAPTASAATSTTQLATTAFATTADNLKANLASPTFTGTPAAPTASAATNTTQVATTAFVQGEITAKAPLASPTFTGNPLAPTPSANDNDTSIATTAYVQAELTAYVSDTVAFTNKTLTDAVNSPTTGLANLTGYLGVPLQSKSADYTLAIADVGTGILHPTADNNARTITIPANASVAIPVGAIIPIYNQINTVTVAITTDTLIFQPTAATGSRTMAAGSKLVLEKITTTIWWCTAFNTT